MIKKFCDMCKQEIETNTVEARPYYLTESYGLDLCESCKRKWDEFRNETHDKYNKMYDELASQERAEVLAFLGMKEFPKGMMLEDD